MNKVSRKDLVSILLQLPVGEREKYIEGREKQRTSQEIDAGNDSLSESKRDIAPEGWATYTALFQRFTRRHIRKIANRYRDSNPDWFRQFEVKIKAEFYRVHEHYSPQLVGIIEKQLSAYKKPPEGWVTRGELMRKLNTQSPTIARVAEQFRPSRAEWFKEFFHRKGVMREFYSPELAAQIQNVLSRRELAPEGWTTITPLARHLRIDPTAVKRLAENFRSGNPEWFGIFASRGGKGRPGEYISPELAHMIEENLKQYERQVPTGWATVSELSDDFQRDYNILKGEVESCKSSHPEWSKLIWRSGGLFEYLAPELAEIVRGKFSIPKAPDEWLTAKTLETKRIAAGASRPTISQFVEQFREEHPEWFRNYRPKRGPVTEHYSPELVALMKEEFAKYEPVPEGWMANGSLAPKLQVGQGTLKLLADRYRESHPDWFQRFKTISGVYEYYSPDLVKLLSGEISLESAERSKELVGKAMLKRYFKPLLDRYLLERDIRKVKFLEFLDKVVAECKTERALRRYLNQPNK